MNYPRIALQGIDGLVFVSNEDVLYAIADGNYTHVHLNDQQEVKVLRTLNEVSQLLNNDSFVRIHRGTLVNLNHVIRMDGDNVLMSNGKSLALARDRKSDFIEKFTRV